MTLRFSIVVPVILTLAACSTPPALSTVIPEPRRVALDILVVRFQDELNQPNSYYLRWLEGASISESGIRLSGATTTLTGIELTNRRGSYISNACRSRTGRFACVQGFDVAVSPGKVATGVFAIVKFGLTNVSDSTISVSTADFHLLDENMTPTEISLESTRRYGRGLLNAAGMSWSTDGPLVLDNDVYMDFEDLEIRAFSSVDILVIFDIPRTGVERTLKLRFRDDPHVDLVVGE